MLSTPIWTHWSLYLAPFLLLLIPSLFFFSLSLSSSRFIHEKVSLGSVPETQRKDKIFYRGEWKFIGRKRFSCIYTSGMNTSVHILTAISMRKFKFSPKGDFLYRYTKAANHTWCIALLCILVENDKQWFVFYSVAVVKVSLIIVLNKFNWNTQILTCTCRNINTLSKEKIFLHVWYLMVSFWMISQNLLLYLACIELAKHLLNMFNSVMDFQWWNLLCTLTWNNSKYTDFHCNFDLL